MAIQSTMNVTGSSAPAFNLPIANPWVDEISTGARRLDNYPDARAFAIIFTCNHCPYAVHVEQALVDIANEYAAKGVQFIAICSNDADRYPDDSFDNMAERARQVQFPFPYLSDATQEIAKKYGAVCTPDIFVYDTERILKYRGRFDETRPGKGTAHGGELKAALDQMLRSGNAPEIQYPSIGCSIKWLLGNEPD